MILKEVQEHRVKYCRWSKQHVESFYTVSKRLQYTLGEELKANSREIRQKFCDDIYETIKKAPATFLIMCAEEETFNFEFRDFFTRSYTISKTVHDFR